MRSITSFVAYAITSFCVLIKRCLSIAQNSVDRKRSNDVVPLRTQTQKQKRTTEVVLFVFGADNGI